MRIKQLALCVMASVGLAFDGAASAAESTEIAGGTGNTGASSRIDINKLEHRVSDASAPVVYLTTEISPAALVKAYEALGSKPTGKVAIKISTGEAGNPNYLQPALIKDLVQKLNGTIVECNTAYGGSRSRTAVHLQTAKDHGFTDIATVDIMDAEGSIELHVRNGLFLKSDAVGKNIENYDYMVVLNHFKGHSMGGFGGALKNASIGVASSSGKSRIHGASFLNAEDAKSCNIDRHTQFVEAMAEAASAVSDYFGKGERIVYVSVMNNMSVDCDCDSHPAEVDMHDIGILSSIDPVALDQACVDLVYAAPDGTSLVKRIESRNGLHVLSRGEEIGLGSRNYQLQLLY